MEALPDSESAGKLVESALQNMEVGLGTMKPMDDEKDDDDKGGKKGNPGGKKGNPSSSSGPKQSVRTPGKSKSKAVEWSGLMAELTKESLDYKRKLKASTDEGKVRYTADMQNALKSDADEITALKNKLDTMYADDAPDNELIALMNEASNKFEQTWLDMESARERLGEKNKQANSHHPHLCITSMHVNIFTMVGKKS